MAGDRRRASGQLACAAVAASKAGLGPWSGPSADSSGASAWIEGAQGLGSSEDPSLYSLLGKHPDVLGSRMKVGAGRALGGVSQKVPGFSPPHSVWHLLSASCRSGPLSAGPSG